MMIQSIEYYYDLAFNDKLECILDDYKKNKSILDNRFEYIEEHDIYIQHNEVLIDGKNQDIEITSYSKIDYLKDLLKAQRKDLYSEIRSLGKSGDDIELEKFLNEFLSIYIKVETLQSIYLYTIILSELKLIIEDVKIQYQNKIGNHSIFNKVKVIDYSSNYFECKDLPYSFFEKLYDNTCELDLIDDVVIAQQDFIDVFTSEAPSETAILKFIKPNPVVAHFLKEIEPFFNNFNGVTIEKSNMFLNKQNKPLKATDLYTALSRGKGKNQDFLNRINTKISELKEAYLD